LFGSVVIQEPRPSRALFLKSLADQMICWRYRSGVPIFRTKAASSDRPRGEIR
jgi:hypothetical protein